MLDAHCRERTKKNTGVLKKTHFFRPWGRCFCIQNRKIGFPLNAGVGNRTPPRWRPKKIWSGFVGIWACLWHRRALSCRIGRKKREAEKPKRLARNRTNRERQEVLFWLFLQGSSRTASRPQLFTMAGGTATFSEQKIVKG